MTLRRLLTLVFCVCLAASAVVADEQEPRRKRILEREIAPDYAQPADEAWREDIKKHLTKKVSFEFVQTPLTECIQFLQNLVKVSVVVDPRSLEEIGGDVPVTLRVVDMPLNTALEWVTRLAGLDYSITNGAIFISTPGNLQGKPYLVVYDVRDLVNHGRRYDPPVLDSKGRMIVFDELNDFNVISEDKLPDMIMGKISPDTWNPDMGTSIEVTGGLLAVMQRRDVHLRIADLLERLHRARSRYLRVEIDIVSVSPQVFQRLRSVQKPGDETVYMPQAALDIVSAETKAGNAVLLDTLSLVAASGQQAFAFSGEGAGRPEEGKAADFTWGTTVAVRPAVNPDGKHVSMNVLVVRQMRTDARPFFFKAGGAFTCLETDTVLAGYCGLPEGVGKGFLLVLIRPAIMNPGPQGKAVRPTPRKIPVGDTPLKRVDQPQEAEF
ncbi:MAG: STN domain-containing protein [Planctomycetes bacterium]|nr:STN domain-containing protein [Planctomycetota bacterium]